MGDLIVSATQTTNVDNGYHSVFTLPQRIPTQAPTVIVTLKEQNVNAIKFKVLGSADGDVWWTEKSETVIGKGAGDFAVVTNPWVFLDVQVKASVGGSQGTVKVDVAGG